MGDVQSTWGTTSEMIGLLLRLNDVSSDHLSIY